MIRNKEVRRIAWPQFRRGRRICTLFLLLIITFSFGPIQAETVDRIVAVVNESVITLSELNKTTTALKREGFITISQEEDSTLHSTVLNQLIERKLMEQAATRAGITVSEQEIDAAIEDVRSKNNLSHDELLMALEATGLTYQDYRERLRTEIEQAKFTTRSFRSQVSIPEEDIKNYYHQNLETFIGPTSYRLGVIAIDDPDHEKVERVLTSLIERLRAGDSFEALAKEYSNGPNAQGGGDLGFLNERELDKTIQAAISKLAVGEFSDIIMTSAGLSIFRLIDRKEGSAMPLDEVREEIQMLLFQRIIDARYREWLERAKKTSHIDIRL